MKYNYFFFLIFLSTFAYGESKQNENLQSMAYVLQADKLDKSRLVAIEKLASCERDLIVIDYSYDSTKEGKWTPNEIKKIRNKKTNRKVVAYISIGEAEDYRDYWNKKWDSNKDGKPDSGAPSFLNILNPDWEGNYKVRYWQDSWQKIILKYIEEIKQQGFDGVYLDIVDAFEFYEYDANKNEWIDNKINSETGNTYRQDMISWVEKIALRTRKTNPNFLIIPQNAPQLLDNPKYVTIVDGIGIEDLFTNGNKKQKKNHELYVLGFINNIQKANKPVFLIEYGKKQKIKKYSITKSKANVLKLLLTNRELSILGDAF